MPTPTMSDEELDSLFRRGAESRPAEPFSEEAWARMEAKLDAATTAQQLRRKVVRGLAVEIALLLVLLWQGYRLAPPAANLNARAWPERAASRPALASRAKLAAVPASSATTSTGYAAPAAPTPLALTEAFVRAQKPILKVVGPAATAVKQAAAGATAPGRRPVALAGVASGRKRSNLRKELAGTTLGARREYAFGVVRPPMKKFLHEKMGILSAASIAHEYPAALGLAPADSLVPPRAPRVLALAPAPLPDTLARLARPAADSARPKQKLTARPAYRLVVGVVGAPAVSAVRTAQTARLGGDFGLTLEYRLAPRLRVRTGLISSQKRYSAASADYEAPASWQWFAADYQVNANCRITEIPLDVRYDVLRRPTYSVFANLGATSLLMRDERYSYDWLMNGQTFTKEAHVVKGSNSLLSVLNLSAGIERPFGARWALQAEPFWQLPLGRVGAGRVRLSSAGVAFSLKYGLFR